jgi:hypothetical protein
MGTGTGEPLEFVDMIVVGTSVAPIAGSTDDGSTITMVTGIGTGEPLGTGLREIETTVITTGGIAGLMIGAAEIGTNTGRMGGNEDGAKDTDAGEIEAGGETASIGTEGLTTGTEGLITGTEGLTTNTGGMLELGMILEAEIIKLGATLEVGTMLEMGTTLELGIMLELE